MRASEGSGALVHAILIASPWIAIMEVAIGIGLLLPARRWRRLTATIAAFLVGGGCVVLIWLRLVGVPSASCGCFGDAFQLDLADHMLLNGAMLGLLVAIGAEARSQAR
jgi:hypothetical protein